MADVTGSAYQEQDRLNVDYDELTGNFSQGSVQTNRKLNETVGGMQMMGSSASQMTEYLLRTIVETWVEKVLTQLVKLEQAYETDAVILGLAGQKAELAQKYGIDAVTDDLLNQSLTVRVNVGVGATNPEAKLGRFMAVLKTYGEAMQMMPDAEPEAIRNEIFGLAGYKGGARFFKQADDPATIALQQQMQEMQQALEQQAQELAAAKLQLQAKDGELQVKAFDAETKRIQVLQPEAPQVAQDNGPNVEHEFAMKQMEALLSERLEEIKAQSAESKEVMKLAAGIIQSQLSKPEKTDPESDGPATTIGLDKLMGAIDALTAHIKAPRLKTIVRDETGRAIAARETIEGY
jgi:hypothetical protein